jgi:ABC-type transporter Mla subunit MlaD
MGSHMQLKNDMKTQHVQRFITLICISLLLFFWGCSENSLTFQVRFPEVSGLKKDDLVYFQKNQIGHVKKVFYTSQGDYLVHVEITPGFKNAVTEDSKFYIEHSPDQEQKMAVIVEQDRPGGVVLKNGAVIQGNAKNRYLTEILGDLQKKAGAAQIELNKTLKELKESFGATSDKLGQQMEATLDDLSVQFNSFADELGKVPDRQEVKNLEESFKQFADEFQKAQKNVQDYLRDEIIPHFRTELERLRKQLNKEGREEELEKIDKQVNKLYTV